MRESRRVIALCYLIPLLCPSFVKNEEKKKERGSEGEREREKEILFGGFCKKSRLDREAFEIATNRVSHPTIFIVSVLDALRAKK